MSPNRLILKGVLAVVARPRLTLAVAGLLVAASAGWGYFRLPISTDQNKLFSEDVPFFRDYLAFVQKFPENEAAYVVIEPADPANPPPTDRWTAVADAVAARLNGMPDVVKSAHARTPLEQLGRQGILFEEPDVVRNHFQDVRQTGTLVDPSAPVRLVMGRTLALRALSMSAVQPPEPGAARFAGAVAEGWNYAIDRPGAPFRLGQGLPDLERVGADTPRDLGYSYVPDESHPDRHLLLVTVYPRENTTALTGVSEIIETIRGGVREAAAPFPEFRVGLTGRPVLDADEMRTTDTDSTRAEVIALAAVFVGMVAMLRSLWLAVAAELCLGVGIGWTFGWASVSVGELNLLSIVFLIALIGIGMDYIVQVLMRYQRERAKRSSPRTTWVAVFKHVGPPITTACLGAAGAFLVSVFTHFKGAADLGVIAGGGLLLCLLSGYTVLPALLTVFPGRKKPASRASNADQGVPPRHPERSEGPLVPRATGTAPASDSARSIAFPAPQSHGPDATRAMDERSFAALRMTGEDDDGGPRVLAYARAAPPARRRRWLVTPLAWLALLLAGVPFMLRARFDPNLINLQAPNLESVKLVRKLQTWSAVFLSNDPGTLRRVRDAVQAAPSVKSTESLLTAYDNADWLRAHAGELPSFAKVEVTAVQPDDLPALADKARKLADRYAAAAANATTAQARLDLGGAAAALRGFADRASTADESGRARVAGRLTAWQPAFVAELQENLAQFNPGPVDVAAVPPEMREHFVSGVDGTYALYVYPKKDLWDRAALAEFVREVEKKAAAVPGAPPPTGIAVNIFHSTSSIKKAFVLATGYALGLIVLLVLADLRDVRQTLLAVSVLGLGLPMLVALMGLLGVTWNFANFFGLPILIGAGHEYGVFMVHRYREALRDPRRAWVGWDVSDRALLLCAFITSSSFGFFWALGHHAGLKSLGLVMALGTACIYLATVLALRPLLKWRLATRRPAPAPVPERTRVAA